jgi:nitroimidazol reductase NimA-like FMN-containing flavoprotein (pyridoxamine 5'-phosphate oxidase superfamily)
MRRFDKEIKDTGILSEILEKSFICRLGFVANNEAYIVPVNFAFSDGVIYFHSAPAGRKMDLIRENNSVSFEMELSADIVTGDIPCKWSCKYRSLMGRGRIGIENDTIAKKKAMDLIMRKYGATMDLNYEDAVYSRMVIIKVEVLLITGKQSGEW